AFFAQDSYKMTNRLTVTYGLRWEYFGVPHSPSAEQGLDANLYLNAIGGVDTNIFEKIRDARFRRTNQFYRPDYSNFGPRIGLAYDVTGRGTTVFRAAYGMYYDRNFGNATFNAIQNPPNYAVLSATTVDTFGTPLTIAPNEFDMINAAGASFLVSSSARMLDNNLRAPRIQQWNATLEHNMHGLVTSVSYVGTKADNLYSLNNLNQRGSCLLLVVSDPTAPCDPVNTSGRINTTGLTGMNRRANEGFSRYNALQVDVKTQQLAKTGLTLFSSYTFAHSIDNESSFFADSLFEGDFGFGFKDPFQPARDRGSSSNDIRHRFTVSGIWDIPWLRNRGGVAGSVLGGWNVAGIFSAQTGGAFSVYDGSAASQCALSAT